MYSAAIWEYFPVGGVCMIQKFAIAWYVDFFLISYNNCYFQTNDMQNKSDTKWTIYLLKKFWAQK